MDKEKSLKAGIVAYIKEATLAIQKENINSDAPIGSQDSTNALCHAIEAVFLHGLKGTASDKNFWSLLKKYTHSGSISQIVELSQISSDIGRCRAWVRLTINECTLESYMAMMLEETPTLRQYYVSAAFIRDVEHSAALQTYLQGLSEFTFALSVNSTVLNQWTTTSLVLSGIVAHGPVQRPTTTPPATNASRSAAVPQIAASANSASLKSSVATSYGAKKRRAARLAPIDGPPSDQTTLPTSISCPQNLALRAGDLSYDALQLSRSEIDNIRELSSASGGLAQLLENSGSTPDSLVSHPDLNDARQDIYTIAYGITSDSSDAGLADNAIEPVANRNEENDRRFEIVKSNLVQYPLNYDKEVERRFARYEEGKNASVEDFIRRRLSLSGDRLERREVEEEMEAETGRQAGQDVVVDQVDRVVVMVEEVDSQTDIVVSETLSAMDNDKAHLSASFVPPLQSPACPSTTITQPTNGVHGKSLPPTTLSTQIAPLSIITTSSLSSSSYLTSAQIQSMTKLSLESQPTLSSSPVLSRSVSPESGYSHIPQSHSTISQQPPWRPEAMHTSTPVSAPPPPPPCFTPAPPPHATVEDSYSSIIKDYMAPTARIKVLSVAEIIDTLPLDGASPTANNKKTAKKSSSDKTAKHSSSSGHDQADVDENDDGVTFNVRQSSSSDDTYHPMNCLTVIQTEKGLARQCYQCKGCTRPIGMFYGRERLCDFDGCYYCHECHENNEYCIPARIIYNWDFRPYKVCKTNLAFLQDTLDNPLLTVDKLNMQIYSHVPAMNDIKSLRSQLKFLKSYLFTCKHATADEFRKKVSVKLYLVDDIHLYSLKDLTQVPSGILAKKLKKWLKIGTSHVYSCPLCSQKGFYCEICKLTKVIYPFEISTTFRCDVCKSVFHRQCKTSLVPCPKCARRSKFQQQHETVDNIELPTTISALVR